MKVKVIPVLFHRPKNIVSKLIRLTTGSYWNHAGFLITNKKGEVTFVEAVENGVIELTLLGFVKKYYNTCEIKYLNEIEVEDNFSHLIGKKYQFSIFLRFPIFLITKRIFGNESKVTNYFSYVDNDDKYFCFELLAEVVGKPLPHLANGFYFDDRKRKS